MGKSGGRELNYVSDVDVVFVAEPVDGGDDDRRSHRHPLATRDDAASAARSAWPVDAALRPEGKAGPLVRTLASHEAYYRRWASTWEFQALLKARPVAGDLALGAAYVEARRAAGVARRRAARRSSRTCRRCAAGSRTRSRATRPTASSSSAAGGLRDVEFAVQLLQLVHGRGRRHACAAAPRWSRCEQLAAGGYVGREDARHLAEAYRWLRTVEHRLQLHRLRRTHLLPPGRRGRRCAGWPAPCGYRGDVLPLFARERAGYGREVRRLHEKLFYRPLLSAVARLPADEARLTPGGRAGPARGARLRRPGASRCATSRR